MNHASGELIDKTVIDITSYLIGWTGIGHHTHLWAVGGQIERIGLGEGAAPIWRMVVVSPPATRA